MIGWIAFGALILLLYGWKVRRVRAGTGDKLAV
jgi:hypothetical protein